MLIDALIDALVPAYFDGRAVDIIKPACMSRLGFHKCAKGREYSALHFDEPVVGQKPREAVRQLSANTIKIKVLEVTIMTQMKQYHDRHNLTGAHAHSTLASGIGRWQKTAFKLGEKQLAEVINLAEFLFDGSHGVTSVDGKNQSIQAYSHQ